MLATAGLQVGTRIPALAILPWQWIGHGSRDKR